jgi:hypothetical protein
MSNATNSTEHASTAYRTVTNAMMDIVVFSVRVNMNTILTCLNVK